MFGRTKGITYKTKSAGKTKNKTKAGKYNRTISRDKEDIRAEINNRKSSGDSGTIIIIDEIGDLGKKAKKVGKVCSPSKVFGFGVSILENHDKYAKVSALYKEEKGISGELKARKMETIDRIEFAYKIRKSGAKTFASYIDKTKDIPHGWKELDGSDIQIGLLRLTLDEILPRIKSEKITVVVDDHTAYHDEKSRKNYVEDMSETLSRKYGKDIECVTCYRKADKYSNHLQTNDVVSHAIHERKEEHSPWASIAMGQKMRRVGKRDKIEKR